MARGQWLTGSALTLAICAALAGCMAAFRPDVSVDLPETYHEASHVSGKVLNDTELATWWEQFADPLLSELISQTLTNHTDLKIALARVDQARAARRGALSALLPTFGYGAQIMRYEGGDTNSLMLGPFGIEEFVINSWQSNLQAAWELDLFGAGRARLAASREEVRATAADVQAVRLSLVSAVADLYVSYRGIQQQQRLLRDSLTEAEEFLTIAEHSFRAGIVLSTDIDLARAGVAEVEAKIEQSEALLAKLRLNLENICMLSPGSLEKQLFTITDLPHIPLTIASGQPIDLLLRRPDLIAAQARLFAALKQGDAARLDYWPKFTLSGTFGQSGFGIGGGMPGGTTMWMGGLNLVLPLFDFGARKAQVELSDARSREALLRYQKGALDALFDVERALTQLARDAKRKNLLQTQVNERTTVLQKTRRQYEVGGVGRLEMAQARIALLESQSVLLGQQVAQLQTQIHLFRALGGGWQVN